MRFDKPIGIYLLLWPAMWALWIAGSGHPDFKVALVIVAGVVLMRAAGCVINDYADRDFDSHVERTRLRPIASGEVTPRRALCLFVALCLIAFALVLSTNTLTVMLSFPGVLLSASYPYMKRYTYLPQAYLGVAFGWAIPMTFTALDVPLGPTVWSLYLATILWALIYDTQYAMVDREDDLKIGVKSSAILFGDMDRLAIALMQVWMLLLLWKLGCDLSLGLLYFLGIAVAAALFAYQMCLIWMRDKTGCFKAFRNNNWVGFVVFVGLLAAYASRPFGVTF